MVIRAFKLLLLTLALFCFTAASTPAQEHTQTKPDSTVAELIALSEQHFKKGESCFSSGNMECARREFDIAVDTIINSSVDVRSDSSLLIRWRQLVEQIDKYQTTALADSRTNNWKLQDYAGEPDPDTGPAPAALAEDEGNGGPLSIPDFQKRFDELKDLFRTKYNRDMVITGADHEEHRRLYGSGSAYDIRVRDLSTEQIAFIIATGQRLGLHVKDFSTAEKVALHNSRVASLGLPSDTLATSVHIHIDRNTPYRAKDYVAQPASKKSFPVAADPSK